MNTFETNIRLLTPGQHLYVRTRVLRVRPEIDNPQLLQKVAARVGMKLGTACVPWGTRLLLTHNQAIQPLNIEFDDFAAQVADEGEQYLRFANEEERFFIATLVERRLYGTVSARTNWWRFGQFHTWYDPVPLSQVDDIAAYRRYSAFAVVLDSAGIGISVDAATTFLTTRSVADYLADARDSRQKRRFDKLSSRQTGHKGTLLYDLGTSKHKCYFDQFCSGVTCGTTGPMRIKGKSFSSLFEYINETHGRGLVRADGPVARVSFRGLDRPQLVPANRLFVTVHNENLPGSLRDTDKLSPALRRDAIGKFWQIVGTDALGPGMPPIADRFWRPPSTSITVLAPPALQFKNSQVDPPISRSKIEYKKWFNDRSRQLSIGKAFYVPPTAPRTIYFIAPTRCAQDAVKAFSDTTCQQLWSWTGIRFAPVVCTPYGSLEEGIARVERSAHSGVTVFVFDDDDPAAYFEIEYGLKAWRVKRIRSATLTRHFDPVRPHLSDARSHNGNGNGNGTRNGHGRQLAPRAKEVWRWENFVRICALDVFQKLGALPWRVEPTPALDAELSIDVGEGRRQFAVSLLVNRDLGPSSELCLETITEWKADVKHETINREALKSSVIKIFRSMPIASPLKSVVVFRDGKECGDEQDAIHEAFSLLKVENKLSNNFETIFASVHKSGIKGIRLWELDDNGAAINPLEGVALRLRKGALLLCTTGAACLSQGTADPLLLTVTEADASRLEDAAMHFFHSAQLNYSNPSIAQRLAAGLKRTDEELRSRAAQEIRRYK